MERKPYEGLDKKSLKEMTLNPEAYKPQKPKFQTLNQKPSKTLDPKPLKAQAPQNPKLYLLRTQCKESEASLVFGPRIGI